MRLSKRIYAIADAVKAGDSAADIGTDHGYVPMLLIKNGISPRVIMSDISGMSLAKARETFDICGFDIDDDCFRVGDGLETIAPGETDCVIIAGLGGMTIIEILSSDIEKSRSFPRMIFQPRKHSGNLRHFLWVNGWGITDEILAPEGKFVCEIIIAVPSGCADRTSPYPENDIRWKYPETLKSADSELLKKRVGWKLSSIDEEIENLNASSSDKSKEIARLTADAVYLRSLIAE